MTPARVYIDEDTATAHGFHPTDIVWWTNERVAHLYLGPRTACSEWTQKAGTALWWRGPWDDVNQDVVTPCAECWAYEPVDDGQLAMEVG